MNKIILALIFISIITGYLSLIEFIQKKYSIQVEITRKISHIITGLISILFIRLIDDIKYIAGISLCFFIVLLVTKFSGYLKSIHDVNRKSFGSIIYPIPFFICYFFSKSSNLDLYLFLPLLTFILSDPIAATIGTYYPWHPYTIRTQIKTLSGSFAFFLSSGIISFIILNKYLAFSTIILISSSILISFITALIEGISISGSDNISVPVIQLLLIRFIIFAAKSFSLSL